MTTPSEETAPYGSGPAAPAAPAVRGAAPGSGTPATLREHAMPIKRLMVDYARRADSNVRTKADATLWLAVLKHEPGEHSQALQWFERVDTRTPARFTAGSRAVVRRRPIAPPSSAAASPTDRTRRSPRRWAISMSGWSSVRTRTPTRW